MKLVSFVSLIGCSLILTSHLSSCKKSNTSTTPPVYVAGIDAMTLVYWKDGKENFLAPAPQGYAGNSTGITVAGGSVYVSGYLGDSAMVWKDGVGTRLSDLSLGSAVATAITSSGTDVYVAGYQVRLYGYDILYWKNGVKTVVANNANFVTGVSIAVSGGDVYVAASIGNDTAAWYKNGARNTAGSGNCYATGIAVSGGDVYVSGVDKGIPVYWKNGSESPLAYTNASGTARTAGITVSGTDVYIVGTDFSRVAYWKNGTEKILGGGTGTAIAVAGSDVYVAAAIPGSGGTFSSYWKNGSLTTFPAANQGLSGSEAANAIFVAAP